MPNTARPLRDTEIKPSGYKVWIFNFVRPFIKKRVAITLGEYPVLTPAKARAKRDEYRWLLIEGLDPIEHENEKERLSTEKSKNTLKAIADRWIQAKSSRVSEFTCRRYL